MQKLKDENKMPINQIVNQIIEIIKDRIFTTILALVAADQITKFFVQRYMELYQSIHVMPGVAILYTQNKGIAFSMLTSVRNEILIVIIVAILIIVCVMWKLAVQKNKWTNYGFACVVAGAVGNIIDRTINGFVVDFMLLYVGQWKFAVFNLADAYISVGAGILILDELMNKRVKT